MTYTATVRSRIDTTETVTLEATQVNSYRGPDVVREEIAEGDLRGVLYFPGDVEAPPTLLLHSGSGGGVTENVAALFASRGFATFTMASHAYEGRPDDLHEIPLESWRDGLDYLRNRFNDDRVAFMGGSRGGELALLIPSIWPERVDATIAITPSNVVFTACCTDEVHGEPAFTLGGEPVERTQRPVPDGVLEYDPASPLPYSHRLHYMNAMQHPELYGGAIAVEDIDCAVMLMAGGADRTWPGDVGARMAARRLVEHGFDHELVLRVYPGGGHLAGWPLFNATNGIDWVNPDDPSDRFPSGGTVKANALSARHGHHEQLEFLLRNAKGGASR